MITSITSAVSEAIWFAGLAGWYGIRYPFERRAKKAKVANSFFGRRESGLLAFAFLGLCIVPALYVFTGFPASLDRAVVPAMTGLGAVMLGAALWLFFRSHADLGRNWSISLEIREEHRLVTTGVYRFVRHPMYSSFFLLALGQFLLLPNWFAGASGLLGVGVLYAFRVRQEERMMTGRFGSEYRDYAAHTKRLIPWIL
jgi:protein-S-isoprenylcysteine O-methyltransferase Ste14